MRSRKQDRKDSNWFAYILRATKAQMSGEVAVACATLPLHTCAGALAMTPASAGHRNQSTSSRAATPGGGRASHRYSGDESCAERYAGTRAPGSSGQAPRAELVTKELGFSSSNAGNNPWGMGGVDHTSEVSTVQRMLKAMSDTYSSLHLIQEHKLGKYAYLCHVAFNGTKNAQWQWVAWPGKGIRQQGLAALVSVEHVVEHKHRVAGAHCEIAYVGLDLWASGTTAIAINVYFEPGQSLAQLRESCDTLRTTAAETAKHKPDMTLCAGDFNVNMHHPPTAMCTLLEQTMLDLGFVRLDLQGDRRDWITRPRTASHIDGILISANASAGVRSCSNHDWGTDDHTHLAVTATLTMEVRCTVRAPDKDIRLHRVRYRYKQALSHEKRAYEERTGYLSQHGVIGYLRQLRRPGAPMAQARLRPERVDEAACIVGAAIHTAASDTMLKHRRGAPRRPGSHGRMSEQRSETSTLGTAKRGSIKGQHVWDRINSMRPKGSRSGKVHAQAEQKITLASASGPKEVFGRPAIARAVREHTEFIAKHDVLDPEFNVDLARDVEQATRDILSSIEGEHPITAGRTSAELDRLNDGAPVGEEVAAAKDRMRQSEGGAPGLDGIMAWMLLWAHASLIEALLLLFIIVWESQSIPAAWLMVLMVYMAKKDAPDKTHIASCRPLSLRSVLGKLFTRVLYLRLKTILKDVYPLEQMGYKEGLGSDAALWAIRQLIKEATDSDSEVWALLCDWSKAYDRVWRALVMLILHAHGVNGTLWILIYRWLHDTTYVAEFNGVATSPFLLASGLGQGCVLSALLFVAYMSTLTGPTPLMDSDYRFVELVRRVFSSALHRESGVSTDDLVELRHIAAAIIADDTTLTANSKQALEKLLDSLLKWVHDMRAAPNLTKYQLWCSEGELGADGEAHSVHVGSAGLVAARTEVKLVGGKISCDNSRAAVLRAYTPCVMMYQLTIELVMMRFNHEDAYELERSCPMQKFMSAACRDTRMVGHECIADDLQRRLWHTGFWGATGIGRWSTHMVQTQVLGGLSWQNKLRVERIVAWASLTQVTPMDCWPGIAARRCNARSVAELAAGTTPTDPLIASVHADMITLGFMRGLLDMESVVHSDHRKRGRPAREAGALECIGVASTRDDLQEPHRHTKDYPDKRTMTKSLFAQEVADATANWWNATHFLKPKSASRWARMWGNHAVRDRECPIPEFDPDDADENSDSDSTVGSDTDPDGGGTSEDDATEALHGEGLHTIRMWRKRLVTAALRQQGTEWLDQRSGYSSSHGCSWGGSANLWLELNVGAHDRNQSQWTICLRMLQPCRSQSDRVAMIRIWAGVVPTMRSHLAVSNARKAAMPKATKSQWVQCPCGLGPQDSVHLLHCAHEAVVNVRERAVQLADLCIRDNTPARGQSADAFARSRAAWSALEPAQRTLATLGSTGTGMNWHTRSAVVAVAAGSWRHLEQAWKVVNTEPRVAVA